MIKEKLIKLIYDKLNNSKIDNLYLGILIKSIHFHLPGICFIVISFFPKLFASIALIYVTFVSILYYYFNNCFISIIENELLKNYNDLKDLNVVDPVLNLLDVKINNRNRKVISIYVFFFYYLYILTIFIFRFFSK